VLIGHAQVVALCNPFTVADPLADDVAGKLIVQFSLSRRSQVVKELGPWLKSGAADDPI